jgi:hypothetical protein
MAALIKHLHRLNTFSQKILNEAKKESPSLTLIQQILDDREHTINKLKEIVSLCDATKLPKQEQHLLSSYWDNFASLNQDIQSALKHNMVESQEKIALVKKRKKAEEEYQTFEKS